MIALEALIIFILICINGMFALMEISVISSRKAQLQQKAEAGDRRARLALEFQAEPSRFLSTVQIGITLVGIFAGAFGGATLSHELDRILVEWGMSAPYHEILSFGLVVLGITYLTLVVGELVPKRIALSNPTAIAIGLSPLINILGKITRPFTKILTVSTKFVIRLLGVRTSDEPSVSDEEITMLLKQGIRSGQFREAELQIVQQLFRLSDRTVTTIMTPRSEIVWLSTSDSAEVIREKVTGSDRSRFPLCGDDLDDVKGIIEVKNLFNAGDASIDEALHSKLRMPAFVSEQASVVKVIEQMQDAHVQSAIVVDEYGSVQGLVTNADILDALLGDWIGETARSSTERKPKKGEVVLDGQLSIEELCEMFEIREIPESVHQIDTVGGLAMLILEDIPTEGQSFRFAGYHFKVLEMEGLRVVKLEVKAL